MQYILFGAGKIGEEAYNLLGKSKIKYFVDNNFKITGKCKFDNTIDIKDFYDFIKRVKKNDLVIICNRGRVAVMIMYQLLDNGFDNFISYDNFFSTEYENIEEHVPKQLKLRYLKMCLSLYKCLYKEGIEREKILRDNINVRKMHPATGYIRKRQLEIIEFAKSCDKLFDKLNIHPILDGGNLLGFVRHNGFIPWDDDLDFLLQRDEYNRLINYCASSEIVLVKSNQNCQQFSQQVFSDRMTRKFPGRLLLLMFPEHIQLSTGYNAMNRVSIDFFSYDTYRNEYQYSQHMFKLNQIKCKIDAQKNDNDKFNIITDEIEKDKINWDINGKNIYFGIDNFESYYLFNKNSSWIDRSVILPLKLEEFEGMKTYVPNCPQKYLEYEYGKDYMKLPEEFVCHNYWNQIKRTLYKSAEIYCTSENDCKLFFPIYETLRNDNIYAVYVIQSGFMYSKRSVNRNTIIAMLNDMEVEFCEETHNNVEYVFTSEDASYLKMYSTDFKYCLRNQKDIQMYLTGYKECIDEAHR